jgi:hypothetical protein
MLASDAYEKYTQDDMTFENLESVNMDRTFLKRYGIYDQSLSISLTTGQSKLADILYTKSLANKLSDRQVLVNSVNPGTVATGNSMDRCYLT